MRRAPLLLAGTAMALTACNDPWEGEGEIIDRSYDDDDSYSYWIPST
jgi:hypothetical protein